MPTKTTTGSLATDATALTPEAFIADRKYSSNVTSKTLIHYGCAFNAFKGCETEQQYKQRSIALRERGVKPRSINTYRTAINAYLHWVAVEGRDNKCSAACTLHFKLSRQRVEDKILQTFNMEQVHAILNAKPTSSDVKRAQVLAAILLDTGLRMNEALSLRTCDVDLEAMNLRVMGKGRKERWVPISIEGRKWLYMWLRSQGTLAAQQKDVWPFVFNTRTSTTLSHRNAQRDVALLCRKLGIEGVRCSPHTFRHTFAVNYLRSGGNLEFLRRILGHTSISVTQRYLRSLTSDDLGTVHNSFSVLATSGKA